MKKINSMLFVLIILLAFSCRKEDNKTAISREKVSGYVQKGPFLNGTLITISELSSDFIPTGKNFTSQIFDNKGSFEFKNVSLSSGFVELMANGFYFNEIENKGSTAQLILFALSDLTDKSSLNVNILSHLEKRRVEYLISNGSSFKDAKKQAQSEILRIFEIKKSDMPESEALDISKSGEDNAILLAISAILQGKLTEAQLSELLANIATDISEDGELNDNSLGVQLINNANILRTNDIRSNLEKRYESLGLAVTIPGFEKYIKQFVDSTGYIATNMITYPLKYNSRINILNDSSFVVMSDTAYSIAAYLPIGTSIKIVIKPSDRENWGAIGFNAMNVTGCTAKSNYPIDWTITAEGNDHFINLPVMFGGRIDHVNETSIDFFIYENNSTVCTRLKTVRNY